MEWVKVDENVVRVSNSLDWGETPLGVPSGSKLYAYGIIVVSSGQRVNKAELIIYENYCLIHVCDVEVNKCSCFTKDTKIRNDVTFHDNAVFILILTYTCMYIVCTFDRFATFHYLRNRIINVLLFTLCR